MKNKVGNVYGLTVMCPILSDPERHPSHLEEIREVLARLPNGADSPLAQVPTIHMARLFVIPNFVYVGYPAQEDHLRSNYLLFGAEFDGDLLEFVELLLGRCAPLVDSLWRHCVGYPGLSDASAFHRYFRRCQMPTGLFFADEANATTEDVRRALYVKREMTNFAVETQGEQPAELQERFRDLVERLRVAPTPPPGSP